MIKLEDVKKRWEAKDPLAKIMYYGDERLVQENVYHFYSPAPHIITFVTYRLGELMPIIIHDSHLVAMIDLRPRVTTNPNPDMRVSLDGAVVKIITSTVRMQPGFSAMAGMMRDGDAITRCIVGLSSLREITGGFSSLDEKTIYPPSFPEDGELWPELAHEKD